MIDALIKSSKDHPDEIERLKVAQVLVKVSTSKDSLYVIDVNRKKTTLKSA